MSALRPGVRAAYLVRRRLRLDGAGEALNAVLFDDLLGFNRYQLHAGQLLLEYDASRLHLDTLLSRLQAARLVPAATPFNRFRLGWYRYLDSNIAANAADSSSTACSQSPLRFR